MIQTLNPKKFNLQLLSRQKDMFLKLHRKMWWYSLTTSLIIRVDLVWNKSLWRELEFHSSITEITATPTTHHSRILLPPLAKVRKAWNSQSTNSSRHHQIKRKTLLLRSTPRCWGRRRKSSRKRWKIPWWAWEVLRTSVGPQKTRLA